MWFATVCTVSQPGKHSSFMLLDVIRRL